LLEVALDIHQILMLKNKIYNYLLNEILKNFITILLTFTTIAWVVRAVNFLDLMVVDGYSSSIYFQYSLLNITTITTRFVPLALLLSLTMSIIKFERQQELLILWTSGLGKIKIVNIFILLSFFITFFQLLFSVIINPYLLNKSRFLLRDSSQIQINTILKSNDFSDSFKGLTFYIDKKKNNKELENIFIKDVGGNIDTLTSSFNPEPKNEGQVLSRKKNTTIIAKKGFVLNDKLILFEGIIQTLTLNNKIKNIQFEKTELILQNLSTRAIKEPKIQETSTLKLMECFSYKNNDINLNNCSKNFKNETTQNLSRRLGTPLYIPLITVIVSFLLLHQKEKKFNFLKKYILFLLSFVILVSAEILLRFTSFSLVATSSYYVLPLILFLFCYIYLLRKIISERIENE
jgi:lipopolysaccharide export system permease protein